MQTHKNSIYVSVLFPKYTYTPTNQQHTILFGWNNAPKVLYLFLCSRKNEKSFLELTASSHINYSWTLRDFLLTFSVSLSIFSLSPHQNTLVLQINNVLGRKASPCHVFIADYLIWFYTADLTCVMCPDAPLLLHRSTYEEPVLFLIYAWMCIELSKWGHHSWCFYKKLIVMPLTPTLPFLLHF